MRREAAKHRRLAAAADKAAEQRAKDATHAVKRPRKNPARPGKATY
jgi:hypothetical protein